MLHVTRQFAAAVAILVTTSLAATAQNYPARPVTLVVGFTPGGPSDVMSRIVGRKLEELLGQPFVILNRPGAGGNLAAESVATASPDGHTLLMGNNSILATNAALYKKVGYDAQKDFAPITLVGAQPNVLVLNPKVEAKTLADVIALARKGGLNYASSGHGAAAHLAAELFKVQAKVDIAHVPYKGAAPALQDVISGQVHMMFATTGAVMGHIRTNLVRPVAVTTLQRSPHLAEIPTIAEAGLPGFDATTWHGLVAPAATPPAILATLHKATVASLKDPAVAKSLDDLGVEIIGGTPEQFAKYIADEIPKWTAVVKASGAKLD